MRSDRYDAGDWRGVHTVTEANWYAIDIMTQPNEHVPAFESELHCVRAYSAEDALVQLKIGIGSKLKQIRGIRPALTSMIDGALAHGYRDMTELNALGMFMVLRTRA